MVWDQTVGHELAHIVAYRIAPPTRATSFVTEGVAVWFDGSVEPRLDQAAGALVAHDLAGVDLQRLWTEWEAYPPQVAYAAAGLAVDALVQQGGAARLRELLRAQTLDDARRLYGPALDGWLDAAERRLVERVIAVPPEAAPPAARSSDGPPPWARAPFDGALVEGSRQVGGSGYHGVRATVASAPRVRPRRHGTDDPGITFCRRAAWRRFVLRPRRPGRARYLRRRSTPVMPRTPLLAQLGAAARLLARAERTGVPADELADGAPIPPPWPPRASIGAPSSAPPPSASGSRPAATTRVAPSLPRPRASAAPVRRARAWRSSARGWPG
jgi:hypothetical protein